MGPPTTTAFAINITFGCAFTAPPILSNGQEPSTQAIGSADWWLSGALTRSGVARDGVVFAIAAMKHQPMGAISEGGP